MLRTGIEIRPYYIGSVSVMDKPTDTELFLFDTAITVYCQRTKLFFYTQQLIVFSHPV